MMRLALLFFLMLSGVTVAADAPPRVVHVYVALCDNEHQGIAPVSAHLGNGQNPDNNLYWGARYGVRTFLSRAPGWQVLRKGPHAEREEILERLVMYHRALGLWLVADAYDGRAIRTAMRDLLDPPDGDVVPNVGAGGEALHVGRAADLRCYVGHNGLMEFTLPEGRKRPGKASTPIIALACKSRAYLEPHLKARGLRGMLLTEGLMAPEAYTLDAALRAWVAGRSVPEAAAKTYAKYQRISERSARRLFSSLEPAAGPEGEANTAGTRRTVLSLAVPDGYARLRWPAGSFSADVEQLLLKPPGTPVRSWQGTVVRQAAAVRAVIDWPLPQKVQQCADVAMRLRAAWLKQQGEPVTFRSLSGEAIAWPRWLQGRYGLNASGSRIQFRPGRTRRASSAEFEAYLRFVMTYANSASLARDLPRVEVEALRPGDLYIQPDPRGGIGHVSVLLSVCESPRGERLLLLGYGFIPAQDFHLPHPAAGEGRAGWFTLAGFKHHVRQFGDGAFHRFD